MFKNEPEKIINKNFLTDSDLLTKDDVKKILSDLHKQTLKNLEFFDGKFPTPNTTNNIYQMISSKEWDNSEWTSGFWIGIMWALWEFSHDDVLKNKALSTIPEWQWRIENHIGVDHHDMGFLFIPSCVAAYKLTSNSQAQKAALLAADNLVSRYVKNAKFIQAWGKKGSDDESRLIIDCLLNIPILYWASENGGPSEYAEIANNHFWTSMQTVIRSDGTTYHTYYINNKTGEHLYGKTRQGYSDTSCWARGQAWGIYGIALNLKHLPKNSKKFDDLLQLFYKVSNQFLNNLGTDDDVPYWDLIFNDDPSQVRDTSAGAIAVCGFLEALKYLPVDKKTFYQKAAHIILRSLINKYSRLSDVAGSPFLWHGVYSWHSKKGLDEGNIWGDYFFVESLMRVFDENWKPYW
ncbi:glycoside hydrolase family 88 protein [[Mycoplasma] testudinis]|uniref:glycoside hydrolase family 88 protein n=1 Tax=[Mycoplasma] testudinis TaxID=33924 RepID=UPI000484E9E5|nr:glycoside hydrolase family 88 protein [[Mycoplasma] testudinis]